MCPYLSGSLNVEKTISSKRLSRAKKMDTLMRAAMPAHVKLEITLHFLATGSSYLCEEVKEALHEYWKMPITAEEWTIIKWIRGSLKFSWLLWCLRRKTHFDNMSWQLWKPIFYLQRVL
nr:unnamed protein product [Callosobruchus analis]